MNAKLIRFTSSARSKAIVCLATVLMWSVCGLALAKDRKKAAEPEVEEKGYVLAYAVVILPVALGLMMVCRPGRRSDTAKRPVQEDEGSK